MTRRVELSDGRETTVHVAEFELASVRVRLRTISPARSLESACADHGIADAVSGGYAAKPEYEPLGELWIDGRIVAHRPFAEPWRALRGAVLTDGDGVRIDSRDRLPQRPDGSLLQAGPLLVRDGRSAIAGVDDPEGFSATAEEFDQDLTATREPRLALALASDRLLAVAVDGRSDQDAGMTLWELADLLVELGADSALNLDGGSASVIIAGGARLNTPRDNEGEALKRSSESVTAFELVRRTRCDRGDLQLRK